ncbi:hypothetical protein ACSRUE_03805 [Sorangium sp. KYC3313]|uniref:hypothetical protein n=1 Tax=Sorangium sp. KYC3313 TaxID=3449740 RepID=UPI003F8B3A5A
MYRVDLNASVAVMCRISCDKEHRIIMRKSWLAVMFSVASMACLTSGCSALPDGDEPRTSEPVGTSQQPLVYGWSNRYGDINYQHSGDVAVDVSDNIIITAGGEGSVDFGGGALTPTFFGVMLAKLDDSGNHIWSKMFEGVTLMGVATDSAGNVNIVGTMFGTTDFGGGPVSCTGTADIFVAQFDASGNHVWSYGFGGGSSSDYAEGMAIAVDSSDNVIITGNYWGNLAFGSDFGTAVSNDVFLAKLDSSGNPVFGRFFGVPLVPGTGTGRAVAIDGSDNIVISGWYYGRMDFGGGPTPLVSVPDTADAFVAEFDSSGTYLWDTTFGNSGEADALGVATDSLGNVAVVGSFRGNMDIGGGTLTSAGITDIFVAQFDNSGTHLWSHGFGDTDWDTASGVSINDSGDVFVTGNIGGAVDFGGGTLTSAGSGDVFVAQFDDSGTHLWSANYGDADSQGGSSIKIDSNGNAVVTGAFFGSVNFGGTTLTDAGTGDIFLAQFTP